MHKEELISYLSKKYRRSKHHYQEAINEILSGIQHHLADGKQVKLIGFGTFYTRLHKGGKGMNFRTNKPMDYKATRLAAFRPGNLLKQAVKRKKGLFSR